MKLTRGTMAMVLGLVLCASAVHAEVIDGTVTKNGLTGSTNYSAGTNDPTLIVDMQEGEYNYSGSLSGEMKVQIKGRGSQKFSTISGDLMGDITIGDGSLNAADCKVLLGDYLALGTSKLTISATLDMNGNTQNFTSLHGTAAALITNKSQDDSTLVVYQCTEELTLDNAYKGTISGNVKLRIHGSNLVLAGDASGCTGEVELCQGTYVKLDASLFKTGQPYAGKDETRALGSGLVWFVKESMFGPGISSTLDLGDRNLTVSGIRTTGLNGMCGTICSTGADTTLELNGVGIAAIRFGKVEDDTKTDYNIHIKKTGMGAQEFHLGNDDDQYNHNKVGFKGNKITVEAGSLILNGKTGTSDIVIDGGVEVTGGSLGLSYVSVTGEINIDGGTFSLVGANLNIDEDSALKIALGTTMSAMDSTLNITDGGELTVSIDEALQKGQTYDVIQLNDGGTILGEFAEEDVTVGGKTLAELGAHLIYNNSTNVSPSAYGGLSPQGIVVNRIQLVVDDPGPGPVADVPEPGTWALMVLGLFSMGLYSRRRSGKN